MTKSIILLLILTGVTLFGQESNIFKELGIKQIEEYVYDISPSLEFKDSILWKEVVLDSLGRIEWQKGRDVLGNVFEFKHYYSGGKLKEIRKISRGDKTERMQEFL